MSGVRFPSIETVRNALRELKPEPYKLYDATGLKYHWYYAFTATKRHRSAGINYDSICSLIEFLESQGVTFPTPDTYIIARAPAGVAA